MNSSSSLLWLFSTSILLARIGALSIGRRFRVDLHRGSAFLRNKYARLRSLEQVWQTPHRHVPRRQHSAKHTCPLTRLAQLCESFSYPLASFINSVQWVYEHYEPIVNGIALAFGLLLSVWANMAGHIHLVS